MGIALISFLFALLNTSSITESFFFSKQKKFWMLLLNWLVPIIGPVLVYKMIQASLIKNGAVTGDNNSSTYYGANSVSVYDYSDSSGGGE